MSRFHSDPSEPNALVKAGAPLPALRQHLTPSQLPMAATGDETAAELGKYLQVLRRRWLLVVGVFVVVTAAVAVGSLTETPIYRAEGTIEIRKQAAEVVPMDALFQEARISEQYLQTQYAMLRSPTLIRRMLANPELANRLRRPAEGEAAEPQPDVLSEAGVESVRSRLTVDPLVGSRIVRVRFESADPQLSADVVNAVVAEYLEMRGEVAATVQGRLAEQADSVRARLLQDEQTLQNFVHVNGLALLVGRDGEAELAPQERLRRLMTELTEAETEGYRASASSAAVGGSALESDLLQRLRARISEVEGEYARLRPTFTDSFPRVQELRSELAQLDSLVRAEQQRVTTALASQYEATRRRRQLLQAAVNEQRLLMDGFAAKLAEYQRLQRDLDGQKELYALLQQKLKEASVSASLASMDVAILDAATRPTGPVRPLPRRDVPLGAMIGLAVGIGLAFLRDYTDRSVRGAEEIDEAQAPLIGMIPSVPALLKTRNVHDTALTEAFSGLRTSLLFNRGGPSPRTLLVTSVQPGDGKTTVSTNLAISLASLGWKVLLVDADLRRASVHRALGIDGDVGLADYLTTARTIPDWRAFVRREVVPWLDVLPAGTTPLNPADLLSTDAFTQLTGQAGAEYDFVVVDAPALYLNAADARILATSVDGVVLVVRSGNTPRDLMRRVLAQTPNVIGVVLNDINPKKLPAYYGEYGSTPEQRANGTSDVRPANARHSPAQS